MDKLKMTSKGAVPSNVEKIAALFPNCVTERLDKDGNPEAVVDFDKLRQELSTELVEGAAERYQFTWPDKRAANHLANQPTTMTLRPCAEESVGKDGTNGVFDSENLYIEGDNLDVLKVLRETYLGKVKMIYIDPPYNTGNDFVYNDDFAESYEEFAESCKVRDEEGNLTFDPKANGESNGRFHTDWLNMIYPRLKIARDLLSNDGVIFISMDDNEAKNLKAVSDEIFGERNFLAQVVWERSFSPINLMKHFSPSHDYILVYAKDIESAVCNGIPRSNEANDRYSNPDNDPRGVWSSSDISVGPAVEANIYPIKTPSGRFVEPPAGRSWRLSEKAFSERLQDNRIWFGPDGDGVPRIKRFLSELRKSGMTPMTIWKHTEVDHSQGATQKLAKLFDGKKYFDYPKPVELIKRCVSLYSDTDSIVMDFFSGSGTTAQAVMELNAQDQGSRKFILVQLPEQLDSKNEARKLGYNTLCDLAEERIRRAGHQILSAKQSSLHSKEHRLELMLKAQPTATASLFSIEEQKKMRDEAFKKEGEPLLREIDILKDQISKLDIGFRVLKLAESNMEDVFYTPDKLDANNLFSLADNVKHDRTAEDLLFQVMLELGVELSSPIEKESINGVEVFNVKDGFLIATFDKNVNESTITEIAKSEPVYFVMRDASAANDNVLDNFDQLFRHYSPDTIRRIL
jgi:adenine-specific DNA-methyltransferase